MVEQAEERRMGIASIARAAAALESQLPADQRLLPGSAQRRVQPDFGGPGAVLTSVGAEIRSFA